MLLNFPRFNKMKGMGQIVSWSVRDESLHCEGMIKLYHAFNAETGAVTPSVADDIMENCRTVVGLEDKFIDLAFEAGEVQGMTPQDIKQYIRFIADWRLRQLHLPELFGVKENPLPWLQSLLSGVEHANFFEARATEYSKAATQGRWEDRTACGGIRPVTGEARRSFDLELGRAGHRHEAWTDEDVAVVAPLRMH